MRRLHSPSGRREAGAFLAEGPQAVREALADPDRVRTLYVTAGGATRYPELVAAASGVEVVETTDAVLEAIAETAAPQGLVAECALPSATLGDVIRPGALAVALESAADPGNVGTIIRTADAAGASGVVLTPGSVDPFNGKCVRSTAGSLFHLPVVPDAPLEAVREAVTDAGLLLAVATGDGEAELYEWVRDVPAGVCWLLGSEAHGVSEQARALADVRVRIPMAGRAESLNMATAAALCLYASAFPNHGRMSSS